MRSSAARGEARDHPRIRPGRSGCRDWWDGVRALELLLAGDSISAAEAHRIGLVMRWFAGRIAGVQQGRGLAKVLANGPLAAGLVMEAVDAGLNGGIEEGLRFEASAFGVCGDGRSSGRDARVSGEAQPAFRGK